MWLQVPDTMRDTLLEVDLEPASEHEIERAVTESRGIEVLPDTGGPRVPARRTPEQSIEAIRQVVSALEPVSIGRPEVWELATLLSPGTAPGWLAAKAGEADFYLVRFACSFRLAPREGVIEWARFRVLLQPDDDGRRPIAFAIYPEQEVTEVRRNVKVALAPSLSFEEIDVGVGEAGFGFDYVEMQPRVTGHGGGSHDIAWDFEPVRGQSVRGTKWMYALVSAPRGMSAGYAVLDLTADLAAHGFKIPLVLDREQREIHRRTVQLWG
jgi:hypothetical protein